MLEYQAERSIRSSDFKSGFSFIEVFNSTALLGRRKGPGVPPMRQLRPKATALLVGGRPDPDDDTLRLSRGTGLAGVSPDKYTVFQLLRPLKHGFTQSSDSALPLSRPSSKVGDQSTCRH